MKRRKFVLGAFALAAGLLITAPALPLPDAGGSTVITVYAAQTLGKCTAKLSNTADGIKVSWNRVSGADSYAIYRKAGSGSYSKVAEAEGTSWMDADTAGGTSYTYYVQPVSGSDTGSYVAATITRLENVKPSLLNTASGVKVSWSRVSGADSYAVYRKESGGSYECIGETASLTFTDTTAASGTKYNYYVRSCSGDDKSGYSSSAILRLDNPVLSVSNKNAGMKLSWDAVAGADSYNVYRKADGESGYTLIASTEDTAYTDSTAQAGVLYRYYVRAVSGSYQSGYSSKQLRRLEGVTVTVYNASSGVKLSWGEGTAAESYKVYRKVYGGSSYSLIAETEDLSYVDGTAASGTKYTYCVRVANGSDLSSYTKKNITFLAAPEATLSNTSSGLKVSWDKVSGAESYRVFRKAGSGSYTQVAETTGTSWTDTDAEGGTTYRYYVRAIRGAQQSGYASQQAVRLENVTLAAANSYQGVKLSWTESAGAESYRVYRKVSGNGSYELIAETEDLSYIDTTAESGVKYNYCVRVANGTSLSGYSSKAITFLSAPEASLASTADGICVSWDEVAGAEKYVVYRKAGSGSYEQMAETTGTSWTDSDVEENVTYRYYVKAYAGTRASGYTSVTGTYDYDPDLVLDLVVKDGVATDLVTGTTYSGITVDGDYMYAGTVTLPSSYSNFTFEMVADYNESSTKGIISLMKYTSNSGKYEECSNVFYLRELSAVSNRGSVTIPWVADSWNTGYVMTIPVQLYAHVSADYEFLPAGDIYWSFSMDSDNGVLNAQIDGATASATMGTYTTSSGDTAYVNKILPSSFTLTGDHAVKEIRIYDRALTQEEQQEAYEETGIVAPASGINQIVDGLTDMGSSLYFTRTQGGYVVPLRSETEAGTYTVEDGNGRTVTYTISDYEQPDNGIDNSVYESVHITNSPGTLETGKQYPLTAYPYPYRIQDEDGKSDQFDVEWESSDPDTVSVIDGLLIAKKAGTVEITATLMGTDMSDTVTITVEDPEETEDIAWYVPEDYESSDGDSFSDTDYEETTRAIYAAIDEAAENGYNHIIFPQINFYAQPLVDSNGYAVTYYVPTNMTIEFPEGSVFYMMDSEVSRGDPTKIEIHYFNFGVENSDYEGVCEDSHLIMDKYYGERYNTTHSESEYLEENRFVNIGRKAINCTVEIREAYYPSGYFIVVDGTSNTNKSSGVMNYGDFVSGWLNEDGELEENGNWISTSGFITVPDYGSDGYFLSADGQDSYSGKYWGGCSARTYDILWYDADYNLIQADRFQGRGEYYDIPEDAVYFKVSLQQSSLPAPGSGETEDSPWIALHDDGSAKFCEILNTNVYNSATGVFSVVGETDGLWVHDCYTNRNGMKTGDERTGDFENGWTAMRHSVVSNNSFNGYFGNPGGFNTFIHTNYMTNYSGFTGETEMLRYINNTTDYIEISEKAQAHIYYNTIYGIGEDRFNSSIGYIYRANNSTGLWVRSY